MLGASQEDACQVFRAIPVGEFVRIQICRGYPLQLDPTNRVNYNINKILHFKITYL